ncbi:hypothetical protein GPECTOR_71g543 [Gonium pectorale]|uniref:Ankyrin repeat domain-containing protein n=1 Tax=Gonium pectorale TaxID=33097 RepID=A0A150G2T3_GONPE|nr:hypothetical protein GPECTOR_71g543 [Gonium pectorale]|eukprot:KXZ44182.1 hypothetical protein GPECTOR_71g543 [Gonium pectorale]
MAHHVFASHWLAPGATRGLTLKQRRKLLSLTAASGVAANLEVAVQAAGCEPTFEVVAAAAASGQLSSRQWLSAHRCPFSGRPGLFDTALSAAARAGHQHVCEWLGTLGLIWQPCHVERAIELAARGGHLGLADWVMRRYGPSAWVTPIDARMATVFGAARGCDLAALQRRFLQGGWGTRAPDTKRQALVNAAGSLTPDWAAKMEWLEAQGAPRNDVCVAAEAAALPDDAGALARLTWLQGRGYTVDGRAAESAARAGNKAALHYLIGEVSVQHERPHRYASVAALRGHQAVLQALVNGGWPVKEREVFRCLARGGHMSALAWLAGALGEGTVAELLRDRRLFAAAAGSGSMELLAWLRERGCPWSKAAITQAAGSGCLAALELLVEQGCPLPVDGSPYTAACRNGDLAALQGLRRLGVPWGPVGKVALEVLRGATYDSNCSNDTDGSGDDPPNDSDDERGWDSGDVPVPVLRCLLEEGCPMD